MYTSDIDRAISGYIADNHLTGRNELYAVVRYDVEVHHHCYSSRDHKWDNIDEGDLLNAMEADGSPIAIVSTFREADALLSGKTCEFYMGGDILYKRGYAAFGYVVSIDEDGELVYDCNVSAWEAPQLLPFWEHRDED